MSGVLRFMSGVLRYVRSVTLYVRSVTLCQECYALCQECYALCQECYALCQEYYVLSGVLRSWSMQDLTIYDNILYQRWLRIISGLERFNSGNLRTSVYIIC